MSKVDFSSTSQKETKGSNQSNKINDPTNTKEYYYLYHVHSQKHLYLPTEIRTFEKPKWNPKFSRSPLFGEAIIDETLKPNENRQQKEEPNKEPKELPNQKAEENQLLEETKKEENKPTDNKENMDPWTNAKVLALISHYMFKKDEKSKSAFFEKYYPYTSELLKHLYGNKLIRKFLELGNDKERELIFNQMQGRMAELYLDTFGRKVFLQAYKTNENFQNKIINEVILSSDILISSEDGKNLLNEYFNTLPEEKVEQLLKEISKNVKSLLNTQDDILWLQKLIQRFSDQLIIPLINKLGEDCGILFNSQYGNFTIQVILERFAPQDVSLIYQKIAENIFDISTDKYGAYVAQKAIIKGGKDYVKGLALDLLGTLIDGRIALLLLMANQYGNYVIKELFLHCEEQERKRIWETVLGDKEGLATRQYGKVLYKIMEKEMKI